MGRWLLVAGLCLSLAGCDSVERVKQVFHRDGDASQESQAAAGQPAEAASSVAPEAKAGDTAQAPAPSGQAPKDAASGKQGPAQKSGADGTTVLENTSAATADSQLPVTVMQNVNRALPADCPLRTLWALPIPNITITKSWMAPRDMGYDMLLLLSSELDIIAIEASSGRTLWWKKLDGEMLGEPVFSKYAIYLIVNSHLLCLENTGGHVMWRVDIGFPAAGPFTVSEDKKGSPRFAIASATRVIYGLDIVTVTWPPKHGAGSITQKDFSMDTQRPRTLWRFPTDSLVQGQMQVQESFVYATDLNGVIYAINGSVVQLGKAASAWKQYCQAGNFAGVLTSGTFVVIGSRDRNVYCFSRNEQGRAIWRYTTGHVVQKTPVFVTDRWTNRTVVGVECQEGPFIAINDVSGSLAWLHPEGGMAVGLDEEADRPLDERTSVIIAEPDGAIASVRFKDGSLVWRIPAGMFRMVTDSHLGVGMYGVLASNGALVNLGRKK